MAGRQILRGRRAARAVPAMPTRITLTRAA
ncbi:Uncharacterised protein [Mycobacterium tuberculosis]|nr:Uncharacterised protein [Mycobacterium tuberculosis]